MHQIIGFLAFGAAGAIVLHSWDLPRPVIYGFVLVSVSAAALTSATQTLRVEGPSDAMASITADEMPPTEGFVAPPRQRKAKAETAIW